MIKFSYESTGRRPLEEIKQIVSKGGKVIDIGGACSFANDFLDCIIEIRQPQASAKYLFIGDMQYPEFWGPVLKHVEEHGKWQYSICSHTLEDIGTPIYVCRMIERISEKGIIIVPSKHRELARFSYENAPRGYWHHRFVFSEVNNVLTAFPKTNHIEDKRFDDVHKCLPEREELIVEWEGEINAHMVNDDLLYDSFEHFVKCYDALLNDN